MGASLKRVLITDDSASMRHVLSLWFVALGWDVHTAEDGQDALRVLDQCRIRWGQVVGVAADAIWAESCPLVWDDGRLALGPPVLESVRRSIDGVGLGSPLSEGDLVALHWDWVCDSITPDQRNALIHYSARTLALTNTAFEPAHA